jgi:hypothetical protein
MTGSVGNQLVFKFQPQLDVLPPPFAPVGRGADGDVAMA